MEIFTPILQGSYAYILVFQLLIVTALFLTLVYLIVQRVRTAPIYRDIGSDVGAPAAVVSVAQVVAPREAAPAAPVAASRDVEEANAAFQELQARYQVMEQEYLQIKNGNQDTRALQEKIKFLESKLLEYEILQEEISTLGQLKLENEKLKTDLVRLERDVASLNGAPPPEEVKGVEPTIMHETPAPPATEAKPDEASMKGLLDQIEGLAKDKAE